MQQFIKNNSSLITGIILFFILYLLIYSIYLLITTIIGNKKIKEHAVRLYLSNRLKHEYYVPISIIIPTYNNEKEILKTVKELLNLDYNLYEIIVVDDGSYDHTVKSLTKKFNLNLVDRPIRKMIETKEILEIYQTSNQKTKISLLKKEHGGKADALNAGINVAEFPYFVFLPDESRLEKDSLKKLICPILENDQIISCRGIAKALNEKTSLLALAHTLLYNHAYHTAHDAPTHCLFQLFKREVAIDVGGYESIGENFELTRAIENHYEKKEIPQAIKESRNAFCYIKTPNTIRQIFIQRKKWNQSFVRGLISTKNSIFKFLYFLSYKVFSCFIVLIGILAIVLATIYHMEDTSIIYYFLIVYLLFISTLSTITYIEMLYLENRKISIMIIIKTICAAIIETIFLKMIYEVAKIFSFSKNKIV